MLKHFIILFYMMSTLIISAQVPVDENLEVRSTGQKLFGVYYSTIGSGANFQIEKRKTYKKWKTFQFNVEALTHEKEYLAPTYSGNRFKAYKINNHIRFSFLKGKKKMAFDHPLPNEENSLKIWKHRRIGLSAVYSWPVYIHYGHAFSFLSIPERYDPLIHRNSYWVTEDYKLHGLNEGYFNLGINTEYGLNFVRYFQDGEESQNIEVLFQASCYPRGIETFYNSNFTFLYLGVKIVYSFGKFKYDF